jgi:hypothetical protein
MDGGAINGVGTSTTAVGTGTGVSIAGARADAATLFGTFTMNGGVIRGTGTAVKIDSRGKFTKVVTATTIYGATNPDSDTGGVFKNTAGILDGTFEGTQLAASRSFTTDGIKYTDVNVLAFATSGTPPTNPAIAAALTFTEGDKAVAVTLTGGTFATGTITAANAMIVGNAAGTIFTSTGNLGTTELGLVGLISLSDKIVGTSAVVVVKGAAIATPATGTVSVISGLAMVSKSLTASTSYAATLTSAANHVLKATSVSGTAYSTVTGDLVFFGTNKTVLSAATWTTTTTPTITKSGMTVVVPTTGNVDYILVKGTAFTSLPAAGMGSFTWTN